MREVCYSEARGCFRWVSTLYDGLTALFLLWPSTGAAWLLASTRGWGYSIGLIAGFTGLALCFLRPLIFNQTFVWRVPPAFWLFALVAAYVFLRVPFAASPYDAGWEALRWFCLLGAYLAWTQVGRPHGRWRIFLAILICSAALEAAYALFQHVNHSNMVLWVPRPPQYGMRASGTFLCPNHFANLLAMIFPVTVVLLFLPAAGLPLRLLSAYFLIISTPAIYLSESRSAWLGVLGGLLLIPVVLCWRRSRALFFVAVLALPVVAAGCGWVAWHTLPIVQQRFNQFDNMDNLSAGRLMVWQDAPAMFEAAPVWGHGPNSYVWAYPPFRSRVKGTVHWDYPHNEYIQFLLEHGAVGFSLLVLAIGGVVVIFLRAVSRARDPGAPLWIAGLSGAAAAGVIHAFFDFNFHIFPNPHVLVLLIGVGWGTFLAWEEGEGEPADRGRALWLFRGIALLAAMLCLLCLRQSIHRGMSYWWNLRGEIAATSMRNADAEAAYARAIDWHAENPAPEMGLGNLYLAQATWFVAATAEERQQGKAALAEKAVGHFIRAMELNPFEMGAVYGAGRARSLLGADEEALALLRRAAAFLSRQGFYRDQLGLQLRRMKREEEALAVFEQAVEDKVHTGTTIANIHALRKRLARKQQASGE